MRTFVPYIGIVRIYDYKKKATALYSSHLHHTMDAGSR